MYLILMNLNFSKMLALITKVGIGESIVKALSLTLATTLSGNNVDINEFIMIPLRMISVFVGLNHDIH